MEISVIERCYTFSLIKFLLVFMYMLSQIKVNSRKEQWRNAKKVHKKKNTGEPQAILFYNKSISDSLNGKMP